MNPLRPLYGDAADAILEEATALLNDPWQYASIPQETGLLEYKKLPVGTRRMQGGIEHEKQSDGSWKKVSVDDRQLQKDTSGGGSGSPAKVARKAAKKAAKSGGGGAGAGKEVTKADLPKKTQKEIEDGDVSGEDAKDTKPSVISKLKGLFDVATGPPVSQILTQASSAAGIDGLSAVKGVLDGMKAGSKTGGALFGGLGSLIGGGIGALIGGASGAVKGGVIGGIITGVMGAFLLRKKVKKPKALQDKKEKQESLQEEASVFKNTRIRLGTTPEEASEEIVTAIVKATEEIGKRLTPEKYEQLLKERTLNREIAKIARDGVLKHLGDTK